MEIKCKKYEVERSADGKIFTVVITHAGNSNSSSEKKYTANDDGTAITASIFYYRLNQQIMMV